MTSILGGFQSLTKKSKPDLVLRIVLLPVRLHKTPSKQYLCERTSLIRSLPGREFRCLQTFPLGHLHLLRSAQE